MGSKLPDVYLETLLTEVLRIQFLRVGLAIQAQPLRCQFYWLQEDNGDVGQLLFNLMVQLDRDTRSTEAFWSFIDLRASLRETPTPVNSGAGINVGKVRARLLDLNMRSFPKAHRTNRDLLNLTKVEAGKRIGYLEKLYRAGDVDTVSFILGSLDQVAIRPIHPIASKEIVLRANKLVDDGLRQIKRKVKVRKVRVENDFTDFPAPKYVRASGKGGIHRMNRYE